MADATALANLHSVCSAGGSNRERLASTRSHIHQITNQHAKDSGIPADPEVPGGIVQNAVDDIGKSEICGKRMDPGLRIVCREKVKAFSICADPKIVLRIQGQRGDDVAGKPIAFCIVDKFSAHKMAETMQRTNPQAAVVPLCQCCPKIVGQTVRLRINCGAVAVDLCQSM